MPSVVETIILILLVAVIILLLVIILKRDKTNINEMFYDLKDRLNTTIKSEMEPFINIVVKTQDMNFERFGNTIDSRLKSAADANAKSVLQTEQKLENIRTKLDNSLESIRKTLSEAIKDLQNTNEKKLDEIRNTVDEKLQKTLEDRITKSFDSVSKRLEEVYKGLGEMQNLAKGVGDLKNVLTNVKTKGILGEMQLGNILEQIMAPEQYVENYRPKPGKRDNVEFAIKLPGDEHPVYLPIDSKFPLADYRRLLSAYEEGNQEEVKVLEKKLEQTLLSFGRDINQKYINVPYTTDFAIMFLPIEGLYAEALKIGVVERLQNEYKINVAGPTTMAALLNSLQMGFRTLAIQKQSGEVWRILGAVKTEFSKFGKVLKATQSRLNQANSELDKLVGVRTRQMQRQLARITSLNEPETKKILAETVEVK